jgi:hypothetical protein
MSVDCSKKNSQSQEVGRRRVPSGGLSLSRLSLTFDRRVAIVIGPKSRLRKQIEEDTEDEQRQ